MKPNRQRPPPRGPTLQVTPLGPGRYQVTGCCAPHLVEIAGGVARCDCGDHRYRKRACRHIRATFETLLIRPLDPVPAAAAAIDTLPDDLADDPPEAA